MKSVEQLVADIPDHDIEKLSFPVKGVGIVAVRNVVNLVEFGKSLGLEPAPHDLAGNLLWDVAVKSNNDAKPLPRSHTSEEFTWHTDASFEEQPPNWFMLQVLHGDNFGGGIQHFISLEDILDRLSIEATADLLRIDLTWDIPPEFNKGTLSRELPVFFVNDEGRISLRYRAECIQRESMSEEQITILQQLLSAINSSQIGVHTPQPTEIIIVNNHQVLHQRTAIKDPNRHLQRVRFV